MSKTLHKLLPFTGIALMGIAFFGLGLGIRILVSTRLSPIEVAEQPALAASWQSNVPSTPIVLESTILTATAKLSETILLEPALTRESLFDNDIQSHLEQSQSIISVDDIEMSVSNVYAFGGHVFISVCFSQPGEESRQLGPTTLYYPQGEITSFYGHVTSNQPGSADGAVGWQCNTLEFLDVPKGTDLSQISLRVESVLLAAPDEGTQCEVYNKRLKQSDRLREIGIQAKCNPESGYVLFETLSKPDEMSSDEALLIINQESAGFVIGPWQFEQMPVLIAE